MKHLFKYAILFLGLFVMTFGCQKDDEVIEDFQQRNGVTVAKAKLSQLKNHGIIGDFVKTLFNNTKHESISFRNGNELINDFYIDTTNVKYIESAESHSYTFALETESEDSLVVQNLVMAKHNDNNDYVALLMTYNLTSEELNQIKNEDFPTSFTNEPLIELIEDIDASTLGLQQRPGTCVSWTTVVVIVPCSHEHHQDDHQSAPCTHPEPHKISVMISEPCSGSSGEGSTDSGDTNNTNGGGHGGIDWGGEGDSPYDPNNVDNSDDLLAEGPLTQINLPKKSKVRKFMLDLLDNEDLNFLNNYPDLELAFNMYLSNSETFDNFEFVDWAIDYLQNMYLVGTYIDGYEEQLEYFNDIVNAQNAEDVISELEFHELADDAISEGSEVDYENRIINNESFTDTNTECLHKKLANDEQDNFYKTMLSSFTTNDFELLSFGIGDVPNGEWGITRGNEINNNNYGFDSYNITISQTIENSSNLSKLVTLCHELIHAYLLNSLDNLGIITYLENGEPGFSLTQCDDYDSEIDINTLSVRDRWIALICAFNENNPGSAEWTHNLFSTANFSVSVYREQLEDFILNNHDWDNETPILSQLLQLEFGAEWQQKTAEYLSWKGLESTDAFEEWAETNNIASSVNANGVTIYPDHNTIITYIRNGGESNCND